MEERSISELQACMASGALSARSLVEQYLARVEAIDRDGPTLNSIIELNPDALDIADALDEERSETGPRGPMHGIPVLIKENIHTADNMTTTAGSLALEGSIAPDDAYLVKQLQKAGAIILGKANLSEWSNFRSPHATSGWSSRGGQTRNPYALDRSPCGSSSGSAVAVAANLCSVAVGIEAAGSILCPSQTNGIVGIKPTLGLISRSGIMPVSHSHDTAGPMTRTVTDAAVFLGALTGVDAEDNATEESHGHAHTDYTPFLDAKGLEGARLGVARNFFGFDPRVDTIMEQCIETMRQAGAEIVDPANVVIDEIISGLFEVLHYEFKADLNAYLERRRPDAPVQTLEELIAFNREHADTVMPFFGQERMLYAQTKGPLTDEAYIKALAANHRMTREQGIDKVLDEHQLDAIIAPSGGPACLIDWVNGDNVRGGMSALLPAVAGYPNITVPAGYIHGLPVGISFYASAWQEPTLIKLAFAFEQASLVRRPPEFLPTVRFD